MFANRWAPGCRCCGGAVVTVYGCATTTGLSGATVKVKSGATVLATKVTDAAGQVELPAPGVGQTLAVSHPSYGAETEVDYIIPAGETTMTVVITPCGVLPEVLYISGSDGWDGELTLTPPTGFLPTSYRGSRLKPISFGADYLDDGVPGTSNCPARPDIECRVTFIYYCESNIFGVMLGMRLQVSHATMTAGGRWIHYVSVEQPSGSPTRCPEAGDPANTAADRSSAATIANGLLTCEPLSSQHTLDFEASGAGVSGQGTWYDLDGEPLMSGTVTYTVTE